MEAIKRRGVGGGDTPRRGEPAAACQRRPGVLEGLGIAFAALSCNHGGERGVVPVVLLGDGGSSQPGQRRDVPGLPPLEGRRPLASIPLGPGLSISMETFMELQHPKPDRRDPTGWPTPPAAQMAVVNAMA